MITIQTAMLVVLGFLSAALVCLLVAPFYRRRAARLATDELKRQMPLTTAEIRADKDRLRAEFAITIHKLESKVEQANFAGARQLVEINRRDAAISALEGEVARMRTFLDEHENARRVLELTIMERLPKVEARLGEAKRLLSERDREVAELSRLSNKNGAALDEATQINAQQRDEIHRLNATLTMHAARNRESLRDPRFDAEVALRAEIEALRAKTRDQSQLIARLQQIAKSGVAKAAGAAGAAGAEDALASGADIARLSKDLAEAEEALKAVKSDGEIESAPPGLDKELRALKSKTQDQLAEIAKLKAALKAYEEGSADERAVKESKITLKARLSALQAQAEEQTSTIQTLRTELAASNEKLARQAQHYMEEMRRLGAGTLPASGPSRRGAYNAAPAPPPPPSPPKRPSLSERIAAPRPARAAPEAPSADNDQPKGAPPLGPGSEPARVGFLRAIDSNGSSSSSGEPALADASEETPVAEQAAPSKARRPGLLERITGLDKQA